MTAETTQIKIAKILKNFIECLPNYFLLFLSILRGFPIGFLNFAIPTKIISESRNPDGLYRPIPIPILHLRLSPFPKLSRPQPDFRTTQASFERQRREPLEGSGGMPPPPFPPENFEIQRLRNALLTNPVFSRDYFLN